MPSTTSNASWDPAITASEVSSASPVLPASHGHPETDHAANLERGQQCERALWIAGLQERRGGHRHNRLNDVGRAHERGFPNGSKQNRACQGRGQRHDRPARSTQSGPGAERRMCGDHDGRRADDDLVEAVREEHRRIGDKRRQREDQQARDTEREEQRDAEQTPADADGGPTPEAQAPPRDTALSSGCTGILA